MPPQQNFQPSAVRPVIKKVALLKLFFRFYCFFRMFTFQLTTKYLVFSHFSVTTFKIGTHRKKIHCVSKYVHSSLSSYFFSYLVRKCDAAIRLFEFFRFKIVASLFYSAISIFGGTFRSNLTRSSSIFTVSSNYGFDIGIFVIRTW